MARSALGYYCGIDELNLPYLACGATGVVSVVGNVAADRTADLIRAVRRGDLAGARALQRALLPLVDAMLMPGRGPAQAAVTAKAALSALGVIPSATVRLPLLELSPTEAERLACALAVGATG
jgi:4-hydroxy-tetrahydrodipicolinate synthase